jgi:hypothetical protein
MSLLNERYGQTARRVCIAVAALLTVPALAVAGDSDFALKTTVAIPGSPLNSFDISWVDPELHAYFLADRTNEAIDVIDTVTKTVTHQFKAGFVGFTGNNNTSGPDGVLTLNNKGTHEIWAGNGPTASCPGAGTFTTACSTVQVIDYATGALLHSIPTGGAGRADELCYDPVDHLIQVANDSDTPPYINFIPTEGPNAYTVVKQIKFGGGAGEGPNATNGIEQCQWNPRTGLIYLNIPEVNGNGADTADGNVVIIDPRKMEIVGQIDIPVSECAGPQGMAIGPTPEILLGCNAKGPPDTGTGASAAGTGPQNAAILNENSGKLHVLPNQGGNDQVWFNPGNGLYFLAEGQNAAQEQLGVVSSHPVRVLQDVLVSNPPGVGRAHSVAADPISNEVFLPIPNNAGSAICPVPANGCVAVFWKQY